MTEKRERGSTLEQSHLIIEPRTITISAPPPRKKFEVKRLAVLREQEALRQQAKLEQDAANLFAQIMRDIAALPDLLPSPSSAEFLNGVREACTELMIELHTQRAQREASLPPMTPGDFLAQREYEFKRWTRDRGHRRGGKARRQRLQRLYEAEFASAAPLSEADAPWMFWE